MNRCGRGAGKCKHVASGPTEKTLVRRAYLPLRGRTALGDLQVCPEHRERTLRYLQSTRRAVPIVLATLSLGVAAVLALPALGFVWAGALGIAAIGLVMATSLGITGSP
jgi:hypothetical protein